VFFTALKAPGTGSIVFGREVSHHQVLIAKLGGTSRTTDVFGKMATEDVSLERVFFLSAVIAEVTLESETDYVFKY